MGYDFSSKESTIDAIINESISQGLALNTQIAYILATVHWETASTFQPVKEAFWKSESWRKNNLRYYPYYGRGYVQLTWKKNYQNHSDKLGVDLVGLPDLALKPEYAVFILIDGFKYGVFTGKKITDFLNEDETDFVQARRCINALDKAEEIAERSNISILFKPKETSWLKTTTYLRSFVGLLTSMVLFLQLSMIGYNHFHPFHAEEARTDQLRWFDHWLKGIDTGIMDEPPVKLEIRTCGSMKPYPFRFENEWPIARTQWTKMYLDIARDTPAKGDTAAGSLSAKPPTVEMKVSYSAGPGHYRPVHGDSGISFETPAMAADTEVTGPLVLNLWVSSSAEDMDIYATIRNIGPDGKDVARSASAANRSAA